MLGAFIESSGDYGNEPETAYPHPRELGLLESAIKASKRKQL